MDDKELLQRLDRLGYPLVEPSREFNVHETLALVVESAELRFWEGFPVLLANAAGEPGFDLAKVEGLLKSNEDKSRLKDLVLVSFALYKEKGLDLAWAYSCAQGLTDEEKTRLESFQESLRSAEDFEAAGRSFSPTRLKNVMQNYASLQAAKILDLGDRHGELALEFALSQVFSPKQKELFKKKLQGAPLSKTEREYFSRVVRKRAAALANSDLHRLARKVIE